MQTISDAPVSATPLSDKEFDRAFAIAKSMLHARSKAESALQNPTLNLILAFKVFGIQGVSLLVAIASIRYFETAWIEAAVSAVPLTLAVLTGRAGFRLIQAYFKTLELIKNYRPLEIPLQWADTLDSVPMSPAQQRRLQKSFNPDKRQTNLAFFEKCFVIALRAQYSQAEADFLARAGVPQGLLDFA